MWMSASKDNKRRRRDYHAKSSAQEHVNRHYSLSRVSFLARKLKDDDVLYFKIHHYPLLKPLSTLYLRRSIVSDPAVIVPLRRVSGINIQVLSYWETEIKD